MCHHRVEMASRSVHSWSKWPPQSAKQYPYHQLGRQCVLSDAAAAVVEWLTRMSKLVFQEYSIPEFLPERTQTARRTPFAALKSENKFRRL